MKAPTFSGKPKVEVEAEEPESEEGGDVYGQLYDAIMDKDREGFIALMKACKGED